jgi:hypothetical protein
MAKRVTFSAEEDETYFIPKASLKESKDLFYQSEDIAQFRHETVLEMAGLVDLEVCPEKVEVATSPLQQLEPDSHNLRTRRTAHNNRPTRLSPVGRAETSITANFLLTKDSIHGSTPPQKPPRRTRQTTQRTTQRPSRSNPLEVPQEKVILRIVPIHDHQQETPAIVGPRLGIGSHRDAQNEERGPQHHRGLVVEKWCEKRVDV